MTLISSRSFHFALAGAFTVLAATASIAPAEARSFGRSGPNPVLKCLGADCNDVAVRHNKRKGPNVQVCGEEVYTENGAVIVPIDPRYCPR
jgi:hypothetical protein